MGRHHLGVVCMHRRRGDHCIGTRDVSRRMANLARSLRAVASRLRFAMASVPNMKLINR